MQLNLVVMRLFLFLITSNHSSGLRRPARLHPQQTINLRVSIQCPANFFCRLIVRSLIKTPEAIAKASMQLIDFNKISNIYHIENDKVH
jgi:hypothetical protein